MEPTNWIYLIDKSDVIAPIILLLFIALNAWMERIPRTPTSNFSQQDKELIKFLGGKHCQQNCSYPTEAIQRN